MVFNEENPKGLVLEETYIKEKIDPDFDADVTLGEDEYYVMGDNRGNSYDSRKFGPVRKGHIIGRVWIRGWPLSKAGIVKSGDYGLQE
ncbi:MAG TPA: signal peptidase I [Candidatus Magasanikbacteria bacterium]|nr:signal peptidase I [Candidatus Magasanikbacteria bacterium]